MCKVMFIPKDFVWSCSDDTKKCYVEFSTKDHLLKSQILKKTKILFLSYLAIHKLFYWSYLQKKIKFQL